MRDSLAAALRRAIQPLTGIRWNADSEPVKAPRRITRPVSKIEERRYAYPPIEIASLKPQPDAFVHTLGTSFLEPASSRGQVNPRNVEAEASFPAIGLRLYLVVESPVFSWCGPLFLWLATDKPCPAEMLQEIPKPTVRTRPARPAASRHRPCSPRPASPRASHPAESCPDVHRPRLAPRLERR